MYFNKKFHCSECYLDRGKASLLHEKTGIDGVKFKQCCKCGTIYREGSLNHTIRPERSEERH